MEVKPFETIRIVTTCQDEQEVDALLQKKIKQGVICQKCGSTRFSVECWIKAEVEVLNESDMAIVTGIKHEVMYVNRIKMCTMCKTKEVNIVKA